MEALARPVGESRKACKSRQKFAARVIVSPAPQNPVARGMLAGWIGPALRRAGSIAMLRGCGGFCHGWRRSARLSRRRRRRRASPRRPARPTRSAPPCSASVTRTSMPAATLTWRPSTVRAATSRCCCAEPREASRRRRTRRSPPAAARTSAPSPTSTPTAAPTSPSKPGQRDRDGPPAPGRRICGRGAAIPWQHPRGRDRERLQRRGGGPTSPSPTSERAPSASSCASRAADSRTRQARRSRWPPGSHRLAGADFNGDGRQDIAVTSDTAGAVTVLLRQAAGGFAADARVADPDPDPERVCRRRGRLRRRRAPGPGGVQHTARAP